MNDRVNMAHGEGGRLTRKLIAERMLPALNNPYLAALGDAAILPRPTGALAMTTDSFVVTPLFFPGGDIGRLAVYGTVNDLVVSGARPLWLSLGMIVEEGLPLATLDRVLNSIASAAQRVGVPIVAGDTKVVPRGAADGLFLNTTGIGEIVAPPPPGPTTLDIGDQLIVNGPIARHGIAVLCAREQLGFEPSPESDCAPLSAAVEALRSAQIPVKAMRDATRGGVAAVLHEWAEACQLSLSIDEEQLPINDETRGACELLGLDPIHVANEGTMLVAVPEAFVAAALAALCSTTVSRSAVRVGEVGPRRPAAVFARRGFGREIPIDEPAGSPLPRIC